MDNACWRCDAVLVSRAHGSAVDAHVGTAIFNNAICGVLSTKTRVLVTHGLQYIAKANQIYVMDDGGIVEQVWE